MKTFDIWHLEIMKNFADADLHARLGRCLQSENSARLPGHRWVGHSCHLHVHPSLHSSTGIIESSKTFRLEVWSARIEINCTFPRLEPPPQTYDFWPFSPMKESLKNAPSLITWRLIETKMCWGVIFLLGGGFALAKVSFRQNRI